ncbi:hypothetical protein NDU88_005665 [Pleurodeles waltl]|uniref:Uncharacterized protein n=1 Tax=Pleurodeles waltl TaxID=8319 RepID=A0AAV7TX86_PLEWA|nr:hypothetical protein NDU88_005665 [Pleurodeles waltl]
MMAPLECAGLRMWLGNPPGAAGRSDSGVLKSIRSSLARVEAALHDLDQAGTQDGGDPGLGACEALLGEFWELADR